jgi:integrase
MTSAPIAHTAKSGAVTYRIRWRFDGAPQSFTHADPHVIKAVRAHVESLNHEVAGTDPRLSAADNVPLIRPVAAAPVLTFGQASEAYLEARVANPESIAKARGIAARYFAQWNDRPLDALTEADVRAWVVNLRAKGRAEKTIYTVFQQLAGVYTRAIKSGAATPNVPALARDACRLKPGNRARDRFMSPDEYATLEAACEDEHRLFVRVSALSGLRWGEVAGLRVEDVVTSGGRTFLDVRRSIGRDAAGGVVLRTPKNESFREVDVEPSLASDLRAYALERGRKGSAFVFATRNGTPWDYSTWHRRAWAPAAAKATAVHGRRFTFHGLRHSHGSWLLEAGISLLEVSRRLGHSSITMTANVYGHTSVDSGARCAAALRGHLAA